MEPTYYEVACPDDDASEEEPEEPRIICAVVKLRLAGVKHVVTAVPCVKLEAVPLHLTDALTEQVKTLKTKLWHANREKGQLVRACESRLRERQAETKIQSRRALTGVVTMSQQLDEATKKMKRMDYDRKYLEKLRYKHEYQIKDLALRLERAEKRARENENEARKHEKKARLESSKLSHAVGAYRQRAAANSELTT